MYLGTRTPQCPSVSKRAAALWIINSFSELVFDLFYLSSSRGRNHPHQQLGSIQQKYVENQLIQILKWPNPCTRTTMMIKIWVVSLGIYEKYKYDDDIDMRSIVWDDDIDMSSIVWEAPQFCALSWWDYPNPVTRRSVAGACLPSDDDHHRDDCMFTIGGSTKSIFKQICH